MKNFSKHKRRGEVFARTAIAAVVASSFFPAASFAQEQEEKKGEATELDAVIVTGTRILSPTVTSSSPIAEIEREEFRFSGSTRVEDLINQYPQISHSFDAFTVNPTTGFPTADLRGLGTGRTLVLVNGHRLPPGGIRDEARDLNQIPAALVKRVEILTGGASAVYGSDAMAGVINFILDTEFTGFSATAGFSGYQHNNDNSYMRGLMDARGFSFPSGDSGLDGRTRNVDLAFGSPFSEGAGHAMAWFTYRQNDELRQGSRDYSSCALNAAGTACGGSATSPNPSFFQDYFVVDANGDPIINHAEDPENPGTFVPIGQVLTGTASRLNPDGTWAAGLAPAYNYAPINHYQRPDDRWTMGGSLKYTVNEHFRPYLDTMFSSTRTSVQIAESGTFFVNRLEIACNDPILGSFCTDLAEHGTVDITDANGQMQEVNAFIDTSQSIAVYVGKRNVEGGPRVSEIEASNFRAVTGVEGDMFAGWYYNASLLYGRNSSNEANINDFLSDRLEQALLQCPPGSFSGCIPYNVWVPGGVTPEAAAALSGTGTRQGATALTVLNAFATGNLGFGLPSAGGDPISLVVGVERRRDEYEVRSDTNMAEGNFTGLGGPRLPVKGQVTVDEFFIESAVPVMANAGFLDSLSLDLGFRRSDYNTSGGVNTYKIGFGSQMFKDYRVRAGFNRAIRAANVSELFFDQQIALFGGNDPCAGESPTFTQAQCANTGVTAAQYGTIQPSPASQYNQFIGGNPQLDPEEANTFTLGFVATPLRGLQASVDYFDIKIEDRIGTIGAQTVLNFCATTGDPFLCNKVRRNSATGDLWRGSSLETSGFVENLNANFGELHNRGVDLSVSYNFPLIGGVLHTSFIGTYMLEAEVAPLPGVNDSATFDCAGVINTSCNFPQVPEWRHIAIGRYSRDWYTASLRWRYIGALDYTETNGSPGRTDQLLVRNGNELDAYNYFDLSGSFDIIQKINITVGVNNILDKEPPLVGSTLSLVGNSLGGYDQLGRYFFTSVGVKF